ncbi:urease accessory protein UreE [Gluconacetobacter azotocaptans]|uniref:urease accessory protein UreE n=1 Tax=Gluconacetobacter azotocaptans TaxID=142834 RepID=UPI0019595779|nr:urease accessory protein UreE [Gluconacetobacter azotocaptans]MBM9403411.1 urease accessory protein UreE [Gluconacetobacter azotocaptans]
MRRVIDILPARTWDPARESDLFRADYEGRHRRRKVLDLQSGARVLLDLPQARLLVAGDGLLLDDGGVARVEALDESLLEVTAPDAHALLRLAWHLGNRHLPAMIGPTRILIRDDHVIADMVRGLGGTIAPLQAPFDPETGAYAGHGGHEAHGHDPHAHAHHGHDHHDHGHHDHGHGPHSHS